MSKHKEMKVILAALAVLFYMFVLSYQGGKQLAKVENATSRAQQ